MCTFLWPNILLRGMKYQLRKQLCSFKNERLISFSHTQFGSWFLKKHITRCMFLHHGACTHQKSKEAHTFFEPLNYLYVDSWFLRNMYTYMWKRIYLKKEAGVSNHFWKKIKQLFWALITYLLKNVKQGTEHDSDSIYEDPKFTADLINTLQFKQMMNLTVC